MNQNFSRLLLASGISPALGGGSASVLARAT
jgi:hypothetical protein